MVGHGGPPNDWPRDSLRRDWHHCKLEKRRHADSRRPSFRDTSRSLRGNLGGTSGPAVVWSNVSHVLAAMRAWVRCALALPSQKPHGGGLSLFSGAAQVLAHEVWPRIGRPRQQGQAGGIGSMAYEIMARNCSKKKLNSGKIAATLTRAGQIIQRKSIDQREQTQTIEETISKPRRTPSTRRRRTRKMQSRRKRKSRMGQTGSGDCDTGQPPACGDSWLLAISAGLRK